MASPAVSGSMALLVELEFDAPGNFATLGDAQALAITVRTTKGPGRTTRTAGAFRRARAANLVRLDASQSSTSSKQAWEFLPWRRRILVSGTEPLRSRWSGPTSLELPSPRRARPDNQGARHRSRHAGRRALGCPTSAVGSQPGTTATGGNDGRQRPRQRRASVRRGAARGRIHDRGPVSALPARAHAPGFLADRFGRDEARQDFARQRVAEWCAGCRQPWNAVRRCVDLGRRPVRRVHEQSTLVQGDTNGVDDVFVHHCFTGSTVRVRLAGAKATGVAADQLPPGMSFNGRFVAFRRGHNLVSGDTNGRWDIFVHDRDQDGDGSFDEDSATTVLISRSSGGVPANFDCLLPSISSTPLRGQESEHDARIPPPGRAIRCSTYSGTIATMPTGSSTKATARQCRSVRTSGRRSTGVPIEVGVTVGGRDSRRVHAYSSNQTSPLRHSSRT